MSSVIDVRTIEPRLRHAQIFGQFDALETGDSITIVNDHDPVPLRFQLESRTPGQVQWASDQAGPDLWRVVITKTQGAAEDPHANGGCCSGGACGG